MVDINDVIKTGTKYGFYLHEYQNNFYIQPVNVVGQSVYYQTAAPTWKKNGQEQIGKSKIVSFPLGDVAQAKDVLTKLIAKLPTGNAGSSPAPTPDDAPF